MKVGINARTFHVSSPEGAVQASIQQTKELGLFSDIDLCLFGQEQIAKSFSDVVVDSTLYPRFLNSQTYGVLWERSILPKRVADRNLDVLYCPNANGPLHHTSYPVVVCVHDVNAQIGMSSKFHYIYRRTTVPRTVKVADCVITVSEFSKRELCRVTSVPESKVRVVHNGIDRMFFTDTQGKQIDIPENYILFVGSLNPRKNITRLVKAFKLIKQRTEIPHKLILAGPPNRMIFKDIKIEQTEEIRHVGFLSQEELKFAYRNADVFAYPSLYEGFGLPPLEAMACGTAVLASDRSPFSETLGSAAELVEPTTIESIGDGLERLLLDQKYREKCEQRGKNRASEFTWEKAGKKLKSILEEIV